MHCTKKQHTHTVHPPRVLQDLVFTAVDITHTVPPSRCSPCREQEYQVSCLCAQPVLTASPLFSSVSTQQHCIIYLLLSQDAHSATSGTSGCQDTLFLGLKM